MSDVFVKSADVAKKMKKHMEELITLLKEAVTEIKKLCPHSEVGEEIDRKLKEIQRKLKENFFVYQSESEKVIKALAMANDRKILVRGKLPSGTNECKLVPGTKTLKAKQVLYCLLNDIAADLNVKIDLQKLFEELGLKKKNFHMLM
ncbi:MAG TPA: hypothetical protein ENF67_00055 [Candidatus Pacearchaeota archaeon]|nr:hypothetical protein [Candidatus Pacearchaeota archaeon]